MSRILVMFTVVLAAAALPACATEADDPGYASDQAALSSSAKPPLDPSQLPAGSEILEGTPPGALVAVIPDSATCPAGSVCVFQNANRGGIRLSISLGAGQGVNLNALACGSCTNGIHGNDGTWNDQMSSWENAAGVLYCWAVNTNGGGTRHTMGAGVGLQNVTAAENDTASSVDRLGC